jgi:hypothetical protein
MPFPYLAPIKTWMKDVLEEREKNPIDTSLKMPWVVLTSGAKVVKDSSKSENATERVETLKKIIGGQSGLTEYNGCIIKNNKDVGLNYQTNETVVGIDFFGKQIKVEGEKNRRASTPTIESIDIDTDGANNTLKTAKVTVRCFSLKQFEMFELFFCKPGMNVLLEYGDNTLDRKSYPQLSGREIQPFSKSSDALIQKTDYGTFIDTFADYYRVDTKSLKTYLQNVERARGTYDLVAGKVTDYSFSIDKDGTYSVNIEISQGNQMTLAIPVNISNDTANLKTQTKNADQFQQWVSQLSADLNLNKSKLSLNKSEWEKEFFNWGKLNTTKKDETASSESYLSLRFILKVLLNYSLVDGNIDEKTFKFEVPKYKVGGIDKEIIPIRIHKNIISSSDDIIFPNKNLPKFVAKVKPSAASDSSPQDNIEISKITEDGMVNGYSIEETANVIIDIEDGKTENGKTTESNPKTGDITCGNALNIFVKYSTLVKIWRSSYTRADFLNSILSTINSNSYGFFRLVYAPKAEREGATVIDYKSVNKVEPTSETLYKFKPTTINSIVRDFSFNFEMSNLVAGRTIFNSQRFLSDYSKNKKPEEMGKEIQLSPDAYKSVDYSMFSNADGFYSINTIDLKAIQKTIDAAVQNKTTQTSTEKEEPKENEAVNLTEIIEQKSVKFILPNGIKTLIFTNREVIVKQLKVLEEQNKNTLTPIDVTITIDGISGFSCGEYFNIDGIPEVYNKIGVFQITNTKHNITNDGWTTTLEASFRINKTK